MTNVTTRDIEQLWQMAFSEPAKAKSATKRRDTPEGIDLGPKTITYNGKELTMFADASASPIISPGMILSMTMDASINDNLPRAVNRLLIQYTALDLAEVRDYNWREPVQEAYDRAGVKLALKDDGSLQTMVFAAPSAIRDPSGMYLSRFFVGHELTKQRMTDTMQWIYRTGKGLENLAATYDAYNRLKD